MKINPNTTKLDELVKTVNGAAQAHTFKADEIRLSIQKAVCRMRDIGVAKKDYHHYTLLMFSGSELPRSYKYKTIRNQVNVVFTKSGEPRVVNFEKLSTWDTSGSLTRIIPSAEKKQTFALLCVAKLERI
jgi:hypothetical protein